MISHCFLLICISLTVGHTVARSVELHFESEEKCQSGILTVIESKRVKIIPSIYFESDRMQSTWLQIDREKSPEYLAILEKKLGNLIIEVRKNTVECIDSKAERDKEVLPSSCKHEDRYNSWTPTPQGGEPLFQAYYRCIDEGIADLTKGYWKIKADLQD